MEYMYTHFINNLSGKKMILPLQTICFHYIDARKSAPLGSMESFALKSATVRTVVLAITWRAPAAVFQGLLDPPAPYEVSVSSFEEKLLPSKYTPYHKKECVYLKWLSIL